ncbi:FAD-dependent monooxygenase [Pseudonocardia lacus]|uniref:FAD-dependent monooxygenase n=1 Tax=Pseudonocardia lacus TaxID=2835865 RepID=UPI001BDD75C5|nr:FAD-dependent monooxygenase [Pseudonocardia lacus]
MYSADAGTSPPPSTTVLISGAGPVGLAAAVELGLRGVECTLVEPRATVSRSRPRAKTINVRTMEHLRRWGLADRLRAAAPLPVSFSQDAVFCTSLSGHELSRFTGIFGMVADGDRFAELGQQAPQYLLEELLREVVGEIPACTLVTGHSVVDLDQDADGVRVAVEGPDGARSTAEARYVIGCDGARSAVRDAIGSAYVGEHALRPNFGMVFRAPELWEHVRHGPAVHYWTVNEQAPTLMGPLDRDGTWWVIAFGVDRESGLADPQRIVDGLAGVPVPAEVLSTDPWTARMELVDRAHRGRVFLAGDAAHLNPPFGGHGFNTGLGDAVDLGWKLAAVLAGWGGPGLLDSYEAERRPIQEKIIEAAVRNMRTLSSELLTDDLDDDGPAGEAARRQAHERIQATKASEFHALDLVLDLGVHGSPVVAADAGGGDGPRAGERLPHAWLDDGRSLYDVLGPDHTLLVRVPDGAADARAVAEAFASRDVPLAVVEHVDGKPGPALLLVRPDQHVAWRGDTAPADPVALADLVSGRG